MKHWLRSEEQQLYYIRQSKNNGKNNQKIYYTRIEVHMSHSELKPNNAKKLIHVGLRGELWVLFFIGKRWRCQRPKFWWDFWRRGTEVQHRKQRWCTQLFVPGPAPNISYSFTRLRTTDTFLKHFPTKFSEPSSVAWTNIVENISQFILLRECFPSVINIPIIFCEWLRLLKSPALQEYIPSSNRQPCFLKAYWKIKILYKMHFRSFNFPSPFIIQWILLILIISL